MNEPHIFIIDDDGASRKSIEALVEPLQVEITSYATADQFLSDYRSQRPACVITDQRMPGLSGIDLLERLREQGHSLAVIIVTAYPDTRSTVRAMRGGAVSLIEKPCHPQELWDTIQTALREDAANYQRDQRRQQVGQRLASLSTSEEEVLRLLVQGHSNKVIASRQALSLRTIESRRAAIFEKLGVRSVAEVTQIWMQAGRGN